MQMQDLIYDNLIIYKQRMTTMKSMVGQIHLDKHTLAKTFY
jgi:hypothetical protein